MGHTEGYICAERYRRFTKVRKHALSTYVPFQREGRHRQKHDEVGFWMLATQVGGGQAGEAVRRGSNLSSVAAESARWNNFSGNSPKALDHMKLRESW